MSELINARDNRTTIRWKLLTSASALALVASMPSALANNDADRPLIWIDLGGSVDLINGTGDIFTPPFTLLTPAPKAYMPVSPVAAQRAPRFTFGPEGSISFQPENSDWSFSAAVQYGRSSGHRDFEQQTPGQIYSKYCCHNPPPHTKIETVHEFLEAKTSNAEQHLILDFQVGKDVGLGMFAGGSSTVDLGVRFAQFTARANATLHARPDLQVYNVRLGTTFVLAFPKFHEYTLLAESKRDFRGVGPSLSWKASAPLAGNTHDGELLLDWGINGALLFGRQRARVHHDTKGSYVRPYQYYRYGQTADGLTYKNKYQALYHHSGPSRPRLRNVTVPNLGATIGLTYRVADFKLNLGYKADYFFGAIDGGIDTAKKTTLNFNGLYASISIGLGGD